MNKVNYYRVFGVAPDVSDETIKNTFQVLLERYDPAKGSDSLFYKTMYQQVMEAYAVLGDQKKREAYNIAMGLPLPKIEKEVFVEQQTINKEDKKDGNNAYVFLLLVVGLIVVGGGTLLYFSLNEENTEVENTEVENTETVVYDIKEEPVLKEEVRTREFIEVEKDKTEKKLVEEPKIREPKNVVPKNKEVKERSVKSLPFKTGASKNEVWAAKGEPTDIRSQGGIEIWYYGKVGIKFKNGKVIN